MPTLTNARHERFSQELAGGKTAIDAYVAAGYKPDRGAASRLSSKDNIGQRVSELLTERAGITEDGRALAVERVAVTKEWVLERLVENAERALQKRPAATDSEGNVTEYKYDGNIANRALELLGKELGMFIDRKEVGEPGEFRAMEDAELDTEIMRRMADLGIAAESPSEASH